MHENVELDQTLPLFIIPNQKEINEIKGIEYYLKKQDAQEKLHH